MIADSALRKQVTRLIQDAYTKVLEAKAVHETAYTSNHVLEAFQDCHEIIVAVSSDAMQKTQLSLFKGEKPLL